MSGLNCVTKNSTGQILRVGFSDFFNDGSFNGGIESYHTDLLNNLFSGVDLKYQKIIASTVTLMTQEEQDSVDIIDGLNLKLLQNYYPLLLPRGEQDTITSDGAIGLANHATRLDVMGGGVMTLADGKIIGIFKKIFNDNSLDVIILLSLDQSTSAYVSITLEKNGKAELIWNNKSTFWAITEEKLLTRNL